MDIAHHVVQCHQTWAASCSLPSATLFVDVRSAFYTVLRQAFVDAPSGNSAFFQAIQVLGLTPDAIASLVRQAQDDKVAAKLSPHVQAVLCDMNNPFFTVAGPSHVELPGAPGRSVDVFFHLYGHPP